MQTLLTPARSSGSKNSHSKNIPPSKVVSARLLEQEAVDTAKYRAETGDTSMLGDAEPLWLAFREQPNDQFLRNALVERYMPLVKNRAERVFSRLPQGVVEMDDLISAGTFGLMDAISAFDVGRGVKFETFCIPRVQGAVLDELRSMDWVPRMVRNKATRINEAHKDLEAMLGRKPTDTEVSEYLDVPIVEYQQMVAETFNVNMSSLDKKWGETDAMKDVREVEVLADKRGEDPTERLHKIDLIRSYTKGLTKNERLILILYYYEDMTMREIGTTLELSESRVSQMHSAIVDRIKRMHPNGNEKARKLF